MKSLLIILNWLLSLCGLCIDTERSPLWAALVCGGWFVVACLLMRYASLYDVKRLFVKVRRFRRQVFRRQFDFEGFNKKLDEKLNRRDEANRTKVYQGLCDVLRKATDAAQ
jgi:hypothetical protein